LIRLQPPVPLGIEPRIVALLDRGVQFGAEALPFELPIDLVEVQALEACLAGVCTRLHARDSL
jgi:hypothetical protein